MSSDELVYGDWRRPPEDVFSTTPYWTRTNKELLKKRLLEDVSKRRRLADSTTRSAAVGQSIRMGETRLR